MPAKSLFKQFLDAAQQRSDALLQEQELAFDKRFDGVVAQYHQAQAAYHQAQTTYNELKAKCTHLRTVLQVKQAVIAQLLPYYPHPITPELRYQLDLT